jgi:hypothetical protein
VTESELLARLKAAAADEAAPPELAARILDSVAYRRRLEVRAGLRPARHIAWVSLTSLAALAASGVLWLRGQGGQNIAAEAPASSTPSLVADRGLGGAPASANPCEARVVATGSTPVVDDFEDGDDALSPQDGRNGFWRWARETDAPGTAPALLPVPRPDAKARNKLALHVKGGRLADWGATVEVTFQPPCYDATAYDGLSLQARGPGRIYLALREVSVIPPFEGGTCANDCYNAHVAKLELGSAFRTFEVKWSELRQRGASRPALDPTRLHSIAFLVRAEDTPYDVWLDEVRFLPRRP